jgi:hypothetical protein
MPTLVSIPRNVLEPGCAPFLGVNLEVKLAELRMSVLTDTL